MNYDIKEKHYVVCCPKPGKGEVYFDVCSDCTSCDQVIGTIKKGNLEVVCSWLNEK